MSGIKLFAVSANGNLYDHKGKPLLANEEIKGYVLATSPAEARTRTMQILPDLARKDGYYFEIHGAYAAEAQSSFLGRGPGTGFLIQAEAQNTPEPQATCPHCENGDCDVRGGIADDPSCNGTAGDMAECAYMAS